MYRKVFPVLLLLALSTQSLADVSAAQRDALVAEARGIASSFQGRLKPARQGALQEGGAVHAIEVCSQQAPRSQP